MFPGNAKCSMTSLADTKHIFMKRLINDASNFAAGQDPVYMEWGTPVWWGRFLLFCVPQSMKTKETSPTRPGSPTPCKQALRPRAVSRLRDETIKSLRSRNNYSPQFQFILLNKTALKIGVQSRLLGDQIRNEEVINSTRNRISSLKVFYFLLYFIDGRVFQDYFSYRIRQNILN